MEKGIQKKYQLENSLTVHRRFNTETLFNNINKFYNLFQ